MRLCRRPVLNSFFAMQEEGPFRTGRALRFAVNADYFTVSVTTVVLVVEADLPVTVMM